MLADHSRCFQTNRAFRDTILASPLIQHKTDLFAAGFKYNATARIDLDDSRKALLRYKSSMNSLRPAEERMVDDIRPTYLSTMKTIGGIHAITERNSVRLFALGSASRGIPYKQWEIPLPFDEYSYDFCPRADLFAVVEWQLVEYVRW